MITFKQFLQEGVSEITDLAQLRTINPAYFEKFHELPLIRGIRRDELTESNLIGSLQLPYDSSLHANIYSIRVRKNRAPLSTNTNISAQIDDWFNEKFGVKPRSTAAFTIRFGDTGGYNVAKDYGFPCIVIPEGHADYIWAKSNDYDDLYNRLMRYMRDNGISVGNPVMDDKQIDSFMKGGNYTMNGDPDTAWGETEIMMVCNSYIAIALETEDSGVAPRYREVEKFIEEYL